MVLSKFDQLKNDFGVHFNFKFKAIKLNEGQYCVYYFRVRENKTFSSNTWGVRVTEIKR